MHVAEKYSCSWTGNPIDLARKAVEIIKVTDDKGTQHHISGGIANWKRGATPQAKITLVVQLASGQLQHRWGGIYPQ